MFGVENLDAWLIYVVIPGLWVLYWLSTELGTASPRRRRQREVGSDVPAEPVTREDLPDPRQWALEALNVSLDSDQAAAVGANTECDVLIAARAGSGKTRVLTTRALWLQQVCGVAPSELLLLAFNTDAAAEMRKRLRGHVGDEVPHAMTFHALGWAANPADPLIADNRVENQWALTTEIAGLMSRQHSSETMRSVIKRLASSQSTLPIVRRLRSAPFRGDWYSIKNRQLDIAAEDAEAAAKDTEADSSGRPRSRVVLQGADTALDGTEVKSYGERMISNVLFENDVKYEYEKLFRWGAGSYRPDFTIWTGPDSGVVIEYFGLMGDPEYRENAARKREYWEEKQNWTLISLEPADLVSRGKGRFETYLLETLADLGVESRPLSPEEIEEGLPKVVSADEYLRAFTGFVVRCRTLGLSRQDLYTRIRGHVPADLEEAVFLEAAAQIYETYLDEVIVDGCDDHNGVVWGAAGKIGQGDVGLVRQGGRDIDLRQVRHVLIDEFQDFSEPFHALIRALRTVNPGLKVFAVGDDWQAINGFAGSDLKFFQRFSDFFPGSITLELPNNYRSAKPIVEASNTLMRRLDERPLRRQRGGVSASGRRGGQVRLWNVAHLQLSSGEEANHVGSKLTAGLLRLLKSHFDKDRDVVLLSRMNTIPNGPDLQNYLDHLRGYLAPQDQSRLSISTTHRYKGQEADAVIVLDAQIGLYPLIHREWKFQRVLGDTIELITAAEKRLFYVALTRARWSLDILADVKENRSPFVEGIGGQLGWWDNLPPGEYVGPEKWDVRVFNAYTVKETLKDRDFGFEDVGRYWHKQVLPVYLTDFSRLERQDWYVSPVVVKVVSLPTGDVVFESHADGSYRFERPPEDSTEPPEYVAEPSEHPIEPLPDWPYEGGREELT